MPARLPLRGLARVGDSRFQGIHDVIFQGRLTCADPRAGIAVLAGEALVDANPRLTESKTAFVFLRQNYRGELPKFDL